MKKNFSTLFVLLLSIFASIYSQAAAFRSPAHDCGEHHCYDVRDSVTRQGGGASGRWIDEITPKRGWACEDLEDLGTGNREQCEMCEREPVRYMHIMTHPHDQLLRVGCICAAYMEGSLDTSQDIDDNIRKAEKRTKAASAKAQREKRDLAQQQQAAAQAKLDQQRGLLSFINHANWGLTKNHDPYINYRGNMVFLNPGRYGGKFSVTVNKVRLKGWHDLVDAKRLAFSVLR